MNENMEIVRKYVLLKDEFEVPQMQKQLSLSYSQTKPIIDELVKDGDIEFAYGVTYRVIKKWQAIRKNHRRYNPRNYDEELYIKALWWCIKNDMAAPSLIQRRCSCGFTVALRALEWMEENGFISEYPERRILITEDEYRQKFGDTDLQSVSMIKKESRRINEDNKSFFERYRITSSDDNDDKETDSDDDNDGNIDESFDDDDDDDDDE